MNTVILQLNGLVLILCLYINVCSLTCYFLLHLYIILHCLFLKVPWPLYYFTSSVSHGIQCYFPRLWGTGMPDVMLYCWYVHSLLMVHLYFVLVVLEEWLLHKQGSSLLSGFLFLFFALGSLFVSTFLCLVMFLNMVSWFCNICFNK